MNRIHPEVVEQIDRLLAIVADPDWMNWQMSQVQNEAEKLRELMEKHLWKKEREA